MVKKMEVKKVGDKNRRKKKKIDSKFINGDWILNEIKRSQKLWESNEEKTEEYKRGYRDGWKDAKNSE